MYRSFAETLEEELHPFFVERILCLDPASWELPYWLKRENYSVLTVHSDYSSYLTCKAFVANNKTRLVEPDWSFAPALVGASNSRAGTLSPSQAAWAASVAKAIRGPMNEFKRGLMAWTADRVVAYWQRSAGSPGAMSDRAAVSHYMREANRRVHKNRKLNGSWFKNPATMAPIMPADATVFTFAQAPSLQGESTPWLARLKPDTTVGPSFRNLQTAGKILPAMAGVPVWCAHVTGPARLAARVEKEFAVHKKNVKQVALYAANTEDATWLVLGW